jgi:Protein of unknown function (DUF2934)
MSKPIEGSSPTRQPGTAEGHPTREEIGVRAHEIYIERGATHGDDMADWLQAERELSEKYKKSDRMGKAALA